MLDHSRGVPGVIVAIPTRNRASLLLRAAESVHRQDYASITLLIADNASTDQTPDACRAISAGQDHVFVHRHASDIGMTSNFNWLMKRALEGRSASDGYFMFLSDDDWLDRDYISTCVRQLQCRPDYSLVAGRTLLEFRDGTRRPDPDVCLLSDAPETRLWDFCETVTPTGVFSGVMPLRIVDQLPPQRNHLGHDWVLLANTAMLGKIATNTDTAIHRDTDGESASLRGLTATLGVSRLQAVRPLVTISYFMAAECLRRSSARAHFPLSRRIKLACVAVLALFSRRAAGRLEHAARHRSARAALRALRSAKSWALDANGGWPRQPVVECWPAHDLEPVPVCPVCGSRERSAMHENLSDQVFGIAPGRWHLHRCRDCEAGFLDPRPAIHAVSRIYGAGYYTHRETLVAPDLADGLSGRRLAGRNAHMNARYNYQLKPASGVARFVGYLKPRTRASDERLFRHLPIPRPGARLLDIGCGSGEFVARANALGWHAEGIDPDEVAITVGQGHGLAVSTTPIEEVAASGCEPFDAITMSHVIEHVPDPVALLRTARCLLRSNGLLWLVTPNLDARGHRRFGPWWMHLDPPRHMVLFGSRAIDDALRRAGFEMVATPRSASGTIASFAQSWRIQRGGSPLEDSPVPRHVLLQGQVAGLFSLLRSGRSEELIRLVRRVPTA